MLKIQIQQVLTRTGFKDARVQDVFYCAFKSLTGGAERGKTLYQSKNGLLRVLKSGTPAPKLCRARAGLHFNWITTPVRISSATYDLLKSENVDVSKFPENYASLGRNKGVPAPFAHPPLPLPRPVRASLRKRRFLQKRTTVSLFMREKCKANETVLSTFGAPRVNIAGSLSRDIIQFLFLFFFYSRTFRAPLSSAVEKRALRLRVYGQRTVESAAETDNPFYIWQADLAEER